MAEPNVVPTDKLPAVLRPKTSAEQEVPVGKLPENLRPKTSANAPQKPETNVGAPTPASAPQGFLQAISPYAVRQPTAPAAPTPAAPAPRQQAAQSLAEGPTIGPAKPLAEEPWYKTAARVVLPKAFGIEEAIVGSPDPDELPKYDKAKTEADIARYSTIKPGQYEFRSEQLTRPLGFLAGVASEVGKNVVELGAQIPELALQLTSPFALGAAEQLQGARAQQVSKEAYRADAEKALTPVVNATRGFVGLPPVPKVDLEPKATKRVFRTLGGPEALSEPVTAEEKQRREQQKAEEKLFPKPSLPVRMQEDIGQIVPGIIQFLATDVFPVLPTPEAATDPTDIVARTKFELSKAFERGEEFPAATAAFAPIVAKAVSQASEGDSKGAVETLLEKPGTMAMTLLPFVHLVPNAPRFLSNAVYDTFGSALQTLNIPKPQWAATMARWLSDPFEMETALKSAKAEAVYEAARQKKSQVRELVKKAVTDAQAKQTAEGGTAFRFGEKGEKIPVSPKPPRMADFPNTKAYEAAVEKFTRESKPTDVEMAETDAALARQEALKAQREGSAYKPTDEFVNKTTAELKATAAEAEKALREEEATTTKATASLTREASTLTKQVKALQETTNTQIAELENQKVLLDQQASQPNVSTAFLEYADQQKAAIDTQIQQLKDNLTTSTGEAVTKLAQIQDQLKPYQNAFEAKKAEVVKTQSDILQEVRKREQLTLQRRPLKGAAKGAMMVEEGAIPGAPKYTTGEVSFVKNPADGFTVVSLDSQGYRGGLTPELAETTRQWREATGVNEATGKVTVATDAVEPMRFGITSSLIDDIRTTLSDTYPGLKELSAQDPQRFYNIVAEAVVDALDNQTLVLLSDNVIRAKVVDYLLDPKNVSLTKQARARAVGHLNDVLRSPDIGETAIALPNGEIVLPNELMAITYEKATGKTAPRDAAGVYERGSFNKLPEDVRNNIANKVADTVADKALVEQLRQGFASETVKVDQANVGEAFDKIAQMQANTGSIPFVIEAGTPAEWSNFLKLMRDNAGPDAKLHLDNLQNYTKPSALLRQKLGLSENAWIDPNINQAYTSVLSLMEQVNKGADSVFGRALSSVKRGLTSRYLTSAINNFKSNQALYTMYYGLGEGVRSLFGALGEGVGVDGLWSDFLNNRTPRGAEGARQKAIFQGIRDAGILDTNAAAAEGILLDRGGGPLPEFLGKKGLPGEKAVRWYNAKQDRVYTFGDNYFKFRATLQEANKAFEVWDKLEAGDTATVRQGKFGELKVRKLEDGTGEVMRPVYDAKGKVLREEPTGRILNEDALARSFTKEGGILAGEKFVDFNRIPLFQAWLRQGAGGAGGLASLFTTWMMKMTDIPLFKKGIISHFIESPEVIRTVEGAGSDAARSFMRNSQVSRSVHRAALMGVARQTIDRQVDDPREERILQRILGFEKGQMPSTSALISEVDPYQTIYMDATSANFLGPSDVAHRGLLSGALLIGDKALQWKNKLFEQADAAQVPRETLIADLENSVLEADRDQGRLMKELRRLYTEHKSGTFFSPREFATLLSARGAGPTFDFVSLLSNPKTTWDDVNKFTTRTLSQYALGGTTKKVVLDYLVPEVAARWQNASPEEKSEIIADFTDKEASYPFNPDRYNYPAVERFIDGMIGIGWRNAYISQMADDGKYDLGKMADWLRTYEKGLHSSLRKEYEKRYNILLETGADPNSPKVKELAKQYEYIDEAVSKQIDAMTLRMESLYKNKRFQEPQSGKVEEAPQTP